MATNDDATQKFFDAMNQGYDAWLDAIRTGNERVHRFSLALLDEARHGQREAIDLGRKWMEAPLDLIGFYGSMIETVTRAQGRALDLSRQWFNDIADSQKDARQVARRVMDANRHAGEAVTEVTRGVFNRAAEAARSVTQRPAPRRVEVERPQRGGARGAAATPAQPAAQMESEPSVAEGSPPAASQPVGQTAAEPSGGEVPSAAASQEPPAAYQPEPGAGEGPPPFAAR